MKAEFPFFCHAAIVRRSLLFNYTYFFRMGLGAAIYRSFIFAFVFLLPFKYPLSWLHCFLCLVCADWKEVAGSCQGPWSLRQCRRWPRDKVISNFSCYQLLLTPEQITTNLFSVRKSRRSFWNWYHDYSWIMLPFSCSSTFPLFHSACGWFSRVVTSAWFDHHVCTNLYSRPDVRSCTSGDGDTQS